MRINTAVRAGFGVLAAAALTVSTAACGGGDDTTALESAKEGTLTIGIKFDQPGLGQRTADGSYAGFDVEVAKYVADKLGVPESGITFKESPSAQRETLLQNGQVDLVVATYTINDERKQRVDFAGPYYEAGQSLLVLDGNDELTGPDDLAGKTVCSVSGSTPAQRIEDEYPDTQLQTYDTYSTCFEGLDNGSIDAITTDDIILAGYASQNPGTYKVVGEPFSDEPYGIGVKKGADELRGKVNDALQEMFEDGSWDTAFQDTVGAAASYATPDFPELDRY